MRLGQNIHQRTADAVGVSAAGILADALVLRSEVAEGFCGGIGGAAVDAAGGACGADRAGLLGVLHHGGGQGAAGAAEGADGDGVVGGDADIHVLTLEEVVRVGNYVLTQQLCDMGVCDA